MPGEGLLVNLTPCANVETGSIRSAATTMPPIGLRILIGSYLVMRIRRVRVKAIRRIAAAAEIRVDGSGVDASVTTHPAGVPGGVGVSINESPDRFRPLDGR